MKIATWNIGSLFADLDNNLVIFERILTQYKPQFLVLQEYVPVEQVNLAIEKSAGLKRMYYMEYSNSHVANGYTMGVAVFGRGSVSNVNVHKLLKPTETFYYNGKPEYFHDKYFLSADWLTEENETVKFVTGHGYSFHRYLIDPTDYIYLFEELESWFKKVVSCGTLVLGDFNVSNPPEVLPWLCQTLKDVYADCATRPSGRKSDCIFLPREVEATDVVNHICFDKKTRSGFDHNYLQITVKQSISSNFSSVI